MLLGWMVWTHAAVAAVPGSVESFPTVEHADSWSLFDYADETIYYPEWANDADPFLYFFHYMDAGLWFFTDRTGSAAWLGDYGARDIQSIQVEVFIDSLEDSGELDCVVFANGPAGWQYYTSALLFAADFPDPGWWELTFDLNTTWYYFEETWIAVEMTPDDFQEVEEIGFRFFPRPGTTAEIYAAIDSVRLEPLVKAPVLHLSKTEEDFQIQFTPLEANICFIEKLSGDATPAWEKVSGQAGITGPAPHVFSSPLSEGRGIFRVGAGPKYRQVAVD